MSLYKTQFCHLRHEGGTKEYRVLVISRQDCRRSVCIRQWGPIGKNGEVRVSCAIQEDESVREMRGIVTEKKRRGYRVMAGDTGDWEKNNSVRDLRDRFDSLIQRLSNNDGAFLFNASSDVDEITPPAPAAPVARIEDMPEIYGSW